MIKEFLLIAIISVLAVSAPAKDGEITEAEVLAEVHRLHSSWHIPSFEYLATAPPEEAWRAYNSIYGTFSRPYQRIVREASLAIANNEAVGAYISTILEKIPHQPLTSKQRMIYFERLGSIPSGWSARVLGRFLFDERPLAGDPPGDTDMVSNVTLAVWGLSVMEFSDGPTKGKHPQVYPKTVNAWKDWWRANESRIDERIREINPDYNPKPPTADVAPTPRSMGSESDQPTASPMADASQATGTTSDGLDLFIYVGGGLLVLAAIGILVHVLRKRK